MTAPRVLLVGIDGVRFEALGRLATPALDRIAERGFLVPVQVDPAAPTISGPSWASILTGTSAGTHLITDNDFRGHGLDDHPDVLTLVRGARDDVFTFAAACWPPLVRPDSGGPLLAGGGYFPGHPSAETPAEYDALDERTTVAVLEAIDHVGGADPGSGSGALLFCYLGGVDEVGHAVGTGADYDAIIEASDQRLGRLLDATLGSDPDGSTDGWTVIVATDHGHRDGGGHGGDDPHERTAWVAACGPDVPADPGEVAQVDVAGHVLDRFGIRSADAGMIGRPFRA